MVKIESVMPVYTGLIAHITFSLSLLAVCHGIMLSCNILFVMSLMKESANAELQGRPDGASQCAERAKNLKR